jgi:nucleoside-diphosphate-sugar epimerase
VFKELKKHPEIKALSTSRSGDSDYKVDLVDRGSIELVLRRESPDILINCAGIVVNSQEAFINGVACRNIFESIVVVGRPYPRVVIMGSAAVYGVVEDLCKPVSEDAALNATSLYGRSKVEEENIAHYYAKEYGIDVVVARIFNPIGVGMGKKFILPTILGQIEDIKEGKSQKISLSRLDSRRDYVDVRDVAAAIFAISTSKAKLSGVYNVGTGISTSNGELVDNLLKNIKLKIKPPIEETLDVPEPKYASAADISRIKAELGWEPEHRMDTTVEGIISEQSGE